MTRLPARRSVSLTYDRQGEPISMRRWGPLNADDAYRQIADTSHGAVRVSTVWLGVDHEPLAPLPVIFETMVFGTLPPPGLGNPCWRYCTEADAFAGHHTIVGALRVHYPLPALPPARHLEDR